MNASTLFKLGFDGRYAENREDHPQSKDSPEFISSIFAEFGIPQKNTLLRWVGWEYFLQDKN